MPRASPAHSTEVEPRDPYDYLLSGVIALSIFFLVWSLTPWFPWK